MLIDLSTIGLALRQARRDAGLSQMELSQKLGIRQGTISRAEAGRDLRTNTLLEIARALDLEFMLVPRRLHANVCMLLTESLSNNHTAVYTGAGDEPYYEDDADVRVGPQRKALRDEAPT